MTEEFDEDSADYPLVTPGKHIYFINPFHVALKPTYFMFKARDLKFSDNVHF